MRGDFTRNLIVRLRIRLDLVHEIPEAKNVDIEHIWVLLLHSAQLHPYLNTIVLNTSNRSSSLYRVGIKQGGSAHEDSAEQITESHDELEPERAYGSLKGSCYGWCLAIGSSKVSDVGQASTMKRK